MLIGKTSGASLRPQNQTGGRPQQPQQHNFQDLHFPLGPAGGGGGMINGMQPGNGIVRGMGQMPPGISREMMVRNGSQGMGGGGQ